ncbi:MAG TPA: hypothetical protein VL091_13075, partial [Marinobacter sp.]|nr:hypothetical protein [Marinobacter sp.]
LTLTDTEGLDSVLQYTVFRDFYRGIQPATAGGDNGLATLLRRHLDVFIGAVPNNDGTDYISVRNPIDLMGEMIRSGRVGNFNEGRQLMVRAIRDGESARYNTPANNALTRFSEPEDEDDLSIPPEDRAWTYPMLDWTYNPNLNGGRVFRATLFVATPPPPPETASVELASASWSGRFTRQNFGASGFNQPEYAATSMTGRTKGNLELLQVFVETQITVDGQTFSEYQKDSLTLTNVSGITIGGIQPDCIKAVLHYKPQHLQVFMSKDEPPSILVGGKNTRNLDYCGYNDDRSKFAEYPTIAMPNRQ